MDRERVNTDRYYTNEFFDKQATDVSKVSKLLTKSNIVKEAHGLFLKFEADLEKLENTVGYESSDYSVYTGTTGIAHLYWLLSQIDASDWGLDAKGEKRLLETKIEQQKKAMSRIEEILNRLKGKRMAYLTGDAGPLSLAIIMYHKNNQSEKALFYWKKLLKLGKLVFDKDGDTPVCNEILYGRAGYLYSLLLVKKFAPNVAEEEFIKQVVDRLISAGKTRTTDSDGILYYEWHEKCYLGAAHGISGILYILLKARVYLDAKQVVYVQKTVDWLLTQRFSSGNLRSSLGSNDDKLVHWCHGAPGAIYVFLEAHEIFGGSQYLDAAIKSGDVIWERGLLKKGYSLCHGVAGNAYGLMALHEYTKDEKYLTRALIFARWCFDYGTKNTHRPDRPLSLFEGMAGVIYMLYDFASPAPKFPAFQL